MSSTSTRYTHDEEVGESVGWEYHGTLNQENGTPIPVASFSSMTIEIYALDSARTTIQAETSILNVGRGVLDPAGLLTITFLHTDSAMVNPAKPRERHLALVKGDYSSPVRKYKREIEWTVKNIEKTT